MEANYSGVVFVINIEKNQFSKVIDAYQKTGAVLIYSSKETQLILVESVDD